MRKLRIHLAALVLLLALLFNLERLDLVGGHNSINLSPLFYVVATIAALVSLAWRRWSRLPPAASAGLILATYLLGHLFMQRPLVGGIHTFVTGTEVLLLIGVALLTLRLGRGVADFEDAVFTLTLGGTDTTVRSIAEASGEVNRALMLSRRNERPLSVVVIEPIADASTVSLRAVEALQRSMLHRFIVNSTANVIADAIRRSDIPMQEADDGRLVVVCPETDKPTATIVVGHIRAALMSKLGLRARVGLASFPGEALTFETLLDEAEVHLRAEDARTDVEAADGEEGRDAATATAGSQDDLPTRRTELQQGQPGDSRVLALPRT